MKYKKLISKAFGSEKSISNVALAAVAGVAVGAVIGVLFAPKSGSSIRKSISNSFRHLLGLDPKNNPVLAKPSIPHYVHQPIKKPKSAIKELTNEARYGEQPDETKA